MTRRLRISDLTDIAVPEQPALSPDGGRVVYVLRTADTGQDRDVTSLWRVDTAGGDPVRLTRGTDDHAPAWSPDGTTVAFVRDSNVWLLPADGGEPEQVTTLSSGAGSPVWSPDGTALAFAAPVDTAPRADPPSGTQRADAPIVTDRLDYQSDGTGLLRTIRSHLHVLDVESRECRQVTEGDWHAATPAWSPDGTKLAFTAATAEDADLEFRVGVHILDITDRRNEPGLAGFATDLATTVTWTADGDALLVVGCAHSPVGPEGFFRLPVTGAADTPAAQLLDLTGSLDRNVLAGGAVRPAGVPQLVDDGAAVLFCVRDRGCTHLYRVGVEGGEPQPVVAGDDQVVSGLSVAGARAAIVLGTATSFGEIATVDLGSGERTVHTHHGDNLADVEWYPRESRDFTISDGTVVQGWLIRDPDRSGPLPLLLDIHGGPHAAWNGAADRFHLYHQELVARGWAVLLVNPRASDSYGTDFYLGTEGAWGEADRNDFLEPLDTLVAEGFADPRRLAVVGYSYGGFMTCYLTSRDTRFAAAVTGGVISDLTSMSGTSDAGHHLSAYELGALPWRDPQRLAELSPFTRVSDVRTPTLVIQGTDDVRCPIGQAEQWHTALRERGVPTRLVLYPGGSHLFILFGPPSHRTDFNERIVDWVQRYAGDVSGPRPARLDAAHWQRRLDVLAKRHNVPGAQLGILRLGEPDDLITAAHGVLNVDTGVTTTTDSVFQIGSITKVWTTTVLMQLVDEGELDIDAAVADVLPELELADPDVAKRLTVRHLLTHTSGIDGDVFDDTGRGDDCVERYVTGLRDAALNTPTGTLWSYCNSGFVLAGRVIEKLTGLGWDAAIRQRLFEPLGLDHTVTLPEEALLHRAAVGHVGTTQPMRTPVWVLPRAVGPAGLIVSTVGDVLAFARLHLTGGVTADGTRLLSAASAAVMAEQHATLLSGLTIADSWGLGWARYDWSGHHAIGHDGGTIGQSAFLRLLPEQGLAVALFTNGGNTGDLYFDLFREIFADVAGVDVTPPPTPPAQPVTADITPWLGTYERASARVEVAKGDDGPVLRATITGALAQLVGGVTEEYGLVADGPDRYLIRHPDATTWVRVLFYTAADGTRWIHQGGRAAPKKSD